MALLASECCPEQYKGYLTFFNKKPPKRNQNKVPVTFGRSLVGPALSSEAMVSQNSGFQFCS